MSMHVVAYESTASNAALTDLTPVTDGLVQISGNFIYVPKGLNNICYAAAMINSAAATLRAQMVTPSLRSLVPFDVSPIVNGLVFGSLPRALRMGYAPVPLVEQEPLEFLTQNGASVVNRGWAHFCDGPVKQVTGKAFTVRFTASASLVTATWVNSSLTFASTLPAGNYQVVGARVWSANSCYARFFFKGSIWRPGMPTANSEDNNEWPDWRFGTYGIWDVFNNVTPPSIDIHGITDTAEQGYLDLIKV